MKKLILSALTIAGIAAFAAPAQSQVLVNSTTSAASATGASTFSNFNGATSSIAGQVTSGTASFNIVEVEVINPPVATDITGTQAILSELTVTATPVIATPPAPVTFEAAAAAALTNVTDTTNPADSDLNAQVSLIRAWTSGGLN